jgi:hypothetical protein
MMEENTISHKPFSIEQRRVLLDDYFSAQESLRETRTLVDRSTERNSQRLLEHEQLYQRKLRILWTQYMDGVPFTALSRCPFSNEVMEHSLDYYDLDGLWWSYEYPARPQSTLLKTYVALTGAVRLDSKIAWAPFVCRPGPEVPYVIPRLLKIPSTIAVLSSIKIGAHQGYVITYFGNPPPQMVPRINTWGANTYIFLDENGKYCWDVEPGSPFDYDFDLEPWISKGLLRWIEPGDTKLKLHDKVDGCPYLGLEGRQKSLVIYRGEVS